MPYKSDRQRRFMHARHPGIARRWDREQVGKSLSGRLLAAAQRKGAKVSAEAAARNAKRAERQDWVNQPGNPTMEESLEAQRKHGLVRGSIMSAQRSKPSGSSNVGKRFEDPGSFDDGPFGLIEVLPRRLERSERTSSTYGGTSSVGRRYTTEVEKVLIPADQLNSAKSAVGDALGRAKNTAMNTAKPLQNKMKAGFQAQRGGYGGAAQGFGERAGALAGQATATPMRQAGTAAGAGALAGMGTMSVLQPQQGLVNPPRTVGGNDPSQDVGKIDLGHARRLQQSFQTKGDEKLARRAFQVHQRAARGPAGQREQMAIRSRQEMESRENLPRAARRRGVGYGQWSDELFNRSDTGRKLRSRVRKADGDVEHRTRHGRLMERTPLHGPRPRHYDPELHRQRRIGAGQTTANLAGGAALAAGGREIYRDSSALRRRRKQLLTAASEVKPGEKAVKVPRAAVKVSTRSGLLAGAGAAALGVGEGIRRYGNDPRSRRWT